MYIWKDEVININNLYVDIKECRENLHDIIIAPYNERKVKGIGYNFSLSEMIYSTKRKGLVPICRNDGETYFYLKPHETVLALSYEHLKVSDKIAGSFHSRVRTMAQGIGSISTTLDPGWNGMMIFTVNNPTDNKIKVLIAKHNNGQWIRESIVTLVPWWIKDPDDEKISKLSLNLDNPPMRLDVWSDLTRKNHQIGDKKYQNFCRLVDSLTSFKPEMSTNEEWFDCFKELLQELEIIIAKEESESDCKAVLVKIKNLRNLPEAVQLYQKRLISDLDDSNMWKKCKQKKYLELIELARRELEYQNLCNQVLQLHKKISEEVPEAWRHNFVANLLFAIKSQAVLIVVFILTVVCFALGIAIDQLQFISPQSFLAMAAVEVVSIVLSIIFQMIKQDS